MSQPPSPGSRYSSTPREEHALVSPAGGSFNEAERDDGARSTGPGNLRRQSSLVRRRLRSFAMGGVAASGKRFYLAFATLFVLFVHFSRHGSSNRPQSQHVDTLLLKTPNLLSLPAHKLLRHYKPNPLWAFHYALDASYDRIVTAGTEQTVIFTCSHGNSTDLCPEAYRVLFIGPTLHSPSFAQSSERLDDRRIKVTYRIEDPGEYEMLAWPEHRRCGHWKSGPTQYNKLAVKGSPLPLQVTGQAPHDGVELCNPKKVYSNLPGRWISKAHIHLEHFSAGSPHHPWLFPQLDPTSLDPRATTYSHFWAPYSCKVPHHSLRDWVDIVKPASLIFFGDSVIRDMFCLLLWPQLFGTPSEGATCAFNDDTGPTGYHTTNKVGTYIREDGGASLLQFFWTPMGDEASVSSAIDSLESPPSHILFSAALWLAKDDPATYVSKLKPALDAMVKKAPQAKTAVRGSSGVVQAIECYDRIGGQRVQLEPNNAALELAIATSYPSIRYFDAYTTLNSHAASSSDGRHWGDVGLMMRERPQVGAGEWALLDRLFFGWT